MGRCVIALALLSPLAALAACPEVIGTYEVTSAQVAPELNNTVARDELTRVAQAQRPGPADGLTDVQFGFRVKFEAGPNRDGCPTTNINARLVADTAVVYIARELDVKGCRFRAVYDHELLHVQIGQRALDQAALALRASLKRAPAAFGTEYIDGLPPESQLRPWLRRELERALEVARAQYTRHNDELDVPEEAHRLANMCDTTIRYHLGSQVYQLDQ
ncbi:MULTISPECIES: hypothetical protein [unclassified Variovorax]|nr:MULTISPECIES: hypothetical protein [unclassified Variovorax]ART90483.1 hypothetical protein [uncultured bacterium]VTU43463.1 hypothetical protein SRS16P1_00552 [Variovorax sp. SRS16]VTU43525.1 hypothetical protein E5P1_00547 [Variovorax sp. PBL-E5]PNG50496.1 hypothetical protein CHC06_06120 [Variovorax sp. B2]PNG51369.1 hypothetical protein CHC07_06026 [Variovorax sp. B4]